MAPIPLAGHGGGCIGGQVSEARATSETGGRIVARALEGSPGPRRLAAIARPGSPVRWFCVFLKKENPCASGRNMDTPNVAGPWSDVLGITAGDQRVDGGVDAPASRHGEPVYPAGMTRSPAPVGDRGRYLGRAAGVPHHHPFSWFAPLWLAASPPRVGEGPAAPTRQFFDAPRNQGHRCAPCISASSPLTACIDGHARFVESSPGEEDQLIGIPSASVLYGRGRAGSIGRSAPKTIRN